MRISTYESITSNLWAENRLLKMVVVIIAVVQIVNSYQISVAMRSQRTILVPASLDKRVHIQGDRASADYIRVFARVVSNLAFNYQFSNARAQFGELLTYFAPESYQAAQKTFDDIASTIEASRVNCSFALTQSITVNAENNTVLVTGLQRQWVDAIGFVDTKGSVTKSYTISYDVRDGRFMVTGIKEKEIVKEQPVKPVGDVRVTNEVPANAK